MVVLKKRAIKVYFYLKKELLVRKQVFMSCFFIRVNINVPFFGYLHFGDSKKSFNFKSYNLTVSTSIYKEGIISINFFR